MKINDKELKEILKLEDETIVSVNGELEVREFDIIKAVVKEKGIGNIVKLEVGFEQPRLQVTLIENFHL